MKKNIIKILSLIAILLLSVQMAYLWKEQMHKDQLTRDALRLVRLKDAEKYGFELWGEYQEFIEQGAWDEDFPCGSTGLRANNHYRHALTGHPLSCRDTGPPYPGKAAEVANLCRMRNREPMRDLCRMKNRK